MEVKGPVMAAGTLVFRPVVVRKAQDLRGIAVADRAVNADRIIGLAFTFLRILGAEAVKDIEDAAALVQGMNDVVLIGTAPVHLRLIAVIQFYPDLFHRSDEFVFKIGCIGLRAGIEGIRHVHVREAHVLFEIVTDGRHVLRHLAKTVEFIPAEQKLCFFSGALKCLHHEITRRDVAEIADMDRAGRADPGCADVFFLIRTAGNDLCRHLI